MNDKKIKNLNYIFGCCFSFVPFGKFSCLPFSCFDPFLRTVIYARFFFEWKTETCCDGLWNFPWEKSTCLRCCILSLQLIILNDTNRMRRMAEKCKFWWLKMFTASMMILIKTKIEQKRTKGIKIHGNKQQNSFISLFWSFRYRFKAFKGLQMHEKTCNYMEVLRFVLLRFKFLLQSFLMSSSHFKTSHMTLMKHAEF